MYDKKVFRFCLSLFIATTMLSAGAAFAATLTFEAFSVASGAEISEQYKANAGTRRDPDTVALSIDKQAAEISFTLTAVGSGFTGTHCELDWDDDGIGSPSRDKYIALANGAFSSVEEIAFAPSRLRLDSSGTQAVLYELDTDNEPDGHDMFDAERYLLVTYRWDTTGQQTSDPNNPNAPNNPGSPSSGGGGGCNAGTGVLSAISLLAAALLKKRQQL